MTLYAKFAVFCFVLGNSSRDGGAFQTFSFSPKLSSQRRRLPTDLSVSLSWTSGKNVTDFSEDGRRKNRTTKRKLTPAPIKIVSIDHNIQSTDTENSHFNEFHKYLKRISQKIRNGERRVHRMDYELKRMEYMYFKLSEDHAPDSPYESYERPYDGPVFRPDLRSYSMVINAYSKSGLGRTAAQKCKEAALRYETFNPGYHANAFMIRGIVKAWLAAGDLDKAMEWIEKMEDNFAMTRSPDDAPDAETYTLYLEALSSSSAKESDPTAGSISMTILRKMGRDFLSEENLEMMPTERTYHATMMCQQKSYTGMTALNKMYTVLKQQVADYEEFGRPESQGKPGVSSVLPVIKFASENRGNMQAIHIMEECIDQLQAKFEETGDLDYVPLEQMFTLLFSAYSKVNFQYAGGLSEKVDRYLSMMERNKMKPSIYVTTAAIRTKVNDRSEKRLREAEEMMRALDHPDAFVYQSLLNGYCRNKNAEKADRVLQELEAAFGANVISMGACITAWSQCTIFSDEALERSQQILSAIIARYREGSVHPAERHVDAWVFEAVARLWVRSRKPECAQRIIDLIKDMERLSEEVPGRFLPSQTLYLLAFDALGISVHTPGRTSLQLLEAYEKRSDEGLLPPPTVRLFSAVVASLTRSSGPVLLEQAVDIYYRILERLKQGNSKDKLESRLLVTMIRTVLGSNKDDAAILAVELLERTVEVARKNPDIVDLSTGGMNLVLDSFAARGCAHEAWLTFRLMSRLADEQFDTLPDTMSYSSLSKALASVRTPLSVDLLDEMVKQLMGMYDRGISSPETQLFDEILSAYRNVGSHDIDAGGQVYDLLLWLESHRGVNDESAPGLDSYRLVCEVLARSGTPDSIQMLEDVYKRARSLSNAGTIDRLDRELCSAAISGYVRQRSKTSIEKAEQIVADMELVREYDIQGAGAPDVRIYNRLLFAYSTVDTVEMGTLALSMFSRMKRAYEQGDKSCKPNIHSYNALILAAARSKPSTDMRGFKIAVAAFKALHQNNDQQNPNSTTYEYFLRACARLIPDGESQAMWTQRAFTECRQRGMVTPRIVRRVCDVLPEVVDELEKNPRFQTMGDREMSDGSRSSYDIPASWCHALPRKDRSRKVEIGEHRRTDRNRA